MTPQFIPVLLIAFLEFCTAGTYIVSQNWPMVGMWTFFGLAMCCLAVAK